MKRGKGIKMKTFKDPQFASYINKKAITCNENRNEDVTKLRNMILKITNDC